MESNSIFLMLHSFQRSLRTATTTFNVLKIANSNAFLLSIRFKKSDVKPLPKIGETQQETKKKLKEKKDKDVDAQKNKKIYQIFGGNQLEAQKKNHVKASQFEYDEEEEREEVESYQEQNDSAKKRVSTVDSFDHNAVKESLHHIMDVYTIKLKEIHLDVADVSLIDDIDVKTGGGSSDLLSNLSMISVDGPFQMQIELYDEKNAPHVTSSVQKRFRDWQIKQGNVPSNLILTLPKPTQQSRLALVQKAKTMLDQAKIQVRDQREAARKLAKASIKSTNILASTNDQIQRNVDKEVEGLEELFKLKEKELKQMST